MGRAALTAVSPAPRRGDRARASGCRLWGADGVERVDFDMGGGAVLLGHAHPDVEAAVASGLSTAADASAALSALLPNAPRARFTADEAQALPAAIEAARRVTSRRRAAVWEPGAGVFGGPRDLAAIVLDPLGLQPAELAAARADADAAGALLIFDEGVSGFRVHARGVQGLSGVSSDLSVFGAQIANGRPLGAIAGRPGLIAALDEADLAPPCPRSLAAATATLRLLEQAPVAARLAVLGAELQAEVARLADACTAVRAFRLAGDPSLPTPLFGAPWMEGLWLREMARRGLTVVGPHALCADHGEPEIARLIAAYARILPMMVDEARPHLPAERGFFVLEARPEGLA
jgi:glutamate-1-semialdehyde 2,1-aminomutase